jgi:hypothetical protein
LGNGLIDRMPSSSKDELSGYQRRDRQQRYTDNPDARMAHLI